MENALIWAIQRPEMTVLFQNFSLNRLTTLIGLFLGKRLEMTPGSFAPEALNRAVAQALLRFFQDETVASVRAELRQARADLSLAADAGESFADQVIALLASLDAAEECIHPAGCRRIRPGAVYRPAQPDEIEHGQAEFPRPRTP